MAIGDRTGPPAAPSPRAGVIQGLTDPRPTGRHRDCGSAGAGRRGQRHRLSRRIAHLAQRRARLTRSGAVPHGGGAPAVRAHPGADADAGRAQSADRPPAAEFRASQRRTGLIGVGWLAWVAGMLVVLGLVEATTRLAEGLADAQFTVGSTSITLAHGWAGLAVVLGTYVLVKGRTIGARGGDPPAVHPQAGRSVRGVGRDAISVGDGGGCWWRWRRKAST
jgi:hypothetical protein